MSSLTAFSEQPIYEYRAGIEYPIPAVWRIEIEHSPAESHPDDPCGRGMETEVRAFLLKFDGDKPRAEAVRLYGLDEVKRQEQFVADIFNAEDV